MQEIRIWFERQGREETPQRRRWLVSLRVKYPELDVCLRVGRAYDDSLLEVGKRVHSCTLSHGPHALVERLTGCRMRSICESPGGDRARKDRLLTRPPVGQGFAPNG